MVTNEKMWQPACWECKFWKNLNSIWLCIWKQKLIEDIPLPRDLCLNCLTSRDSFINQKQKFYTWTIVLPWFYTHFTVNFDWIDISWRSDDNCTVHIWVTFKNIWVDYADNKNWSIIYFEVWMHWLHFIKMLLITRVAHAVLGPQFYEVIFRLSPQLTLRLVN